MCKSTLYEITWEFHNEHVSCTETAQQAHRSRGVKTFRHLRAKRRRTADIDTSSSPTSSYHSSTTLLLEMMQSLTTTQFATEPAQQRKRSTDSGATPEFCGGGVIRKNFVLGPSGQHTSSPGSRWCPQHGGNRNFLGWRRDPHNNRGTRRDVGSRIRPCGSGGMSAPRANAQDAEEYAPRPI